jgi:hypothetical protein
VKQGRLRRLDQAGYAVVEAPADGGREAAPAAGSAEGAAEQSSPAEAPREPPPSAAAE